MFIGEKFGALLLALQARGARLATAIELYRDMDMTFWVPEVEAALTQVEGR